MIKKIYKFAVLGACALMSVQPSVAGSVVKPGFTFPTDRDYKIVVFRPDVQVGSLRTGGMDEPNADWTATARTNMQNAFQAAGEAREANFSFLGDPEGDNAKLLNDFRGLFQVVSNEAMTHALFFDKLPTKKVEPAVAGGKVTYKFDWTLGPDAAKLKSITGADYAMFVFTHDAYGDTGRKVAQVLMAGLFGAYIPPGVHIGYAGLVDLNTGDMLWLNANIAMGGDLREELGAQKRVKELLSGFPKRSSTMLQSAPKADATTPTATPVAAPTAVSATAPSPAPASPPAEAAKPAPAEAAAAAIPSQATH